MSRRPARITQKEVEVLIKAAEKSGKRLVLELCPDGKFRVIVNEIDALQDVSTKREIRL